MTSTMRFDKWEDSLGQPYGTVLQSVQFLDRGQSGSAKTSRVISSSLTFTNLMSKTIVTKQANSAILVLTTATAYTPGSNQRGKVRLTRNGVEIDADHYAFYSPAAIFQQHSFKSLDYPNVSAGTSITYNYDVACSGTGITVQFGYGDGSGGPPSSIVLLEIAQ
jgi:hypothetical protein